jgi:hypothetical protein
MAMDAQYETKTGRGKLAIAVFRVSIIAALRSHCHNSVTTLVLTHALF